MNGRYFSGRQLIAALYDGRERFRRSGGGGDDDAGEGIEAEKKRLDDFTSWLMKEGE